MRRVKRLLKSAAAVAPLVVAMASPASACLLTGASGTAAQHSPQVNQGPMGIGPSAPMTGLKNADQHNGGHKNLCDMMCDPSGHFMAQ